MTRQHLLARIAQLQTEESHEPRASARAALRVTIETLKAKLR